MATKKKLSLQALMTLQRLNGNVSPLGALTDQLPDLESARDTLLDSAVDASPVAAPAPMINTPGWTASGKPSVWQGAIDSGAGLFGSPTNPDIRQTLLGGNGSNGVSSVDSFGSMGSYQPTVGDRTPQSPQLRRLRRTQRRENDPNWRGTTDTILTSGRGVTGPANTQTRTLLGA